MTTSPIITLHLADEITVDGNINNEEVLVKSFHARYAPLEGFPNVEIRGSFVAQADTGTAIALLRLRRSAFSVLDETGDLLAEEDINLGIKTFHKFRTTTFVKPVGAFDSIKLTLQVLIVPTQVVRIISPTIFLRGVL